MEVELLGNERDVATLGMGRPGSLGMPLAHINS